RNRARLAGTSPAQTGGAGAPNGRPWLCRVVLAVSWAVPHQADPRTAAIRPESRVDEQARDILIGLAANPALPDHLRARLPDRPATSPHDTAWHVDPDVG